MRWSVWEHRLGLGVIVFFGDDEEDVYLPEEDFLLGEASPSSGLFLVFSCILIMKSFSFSFDGLEYNMVGIFKVST